MKLRILQGALLAVLFALAGTAAHAADYYVDVNNASSSDTNSGTADRPWKTITKANQTLVAGDTVHIKAGTYSSYIAPVNSGTSSRFITYRNFGTDTVTVSNASYGIHLNGKSNIVVQGINFYNLDKFLWLQNGAHHNTIAYCNFDKGRTIGWSGSKIYQSSKYNWVHHCRFSHYGVYTSQDTGSLLDVGNEDSTTDISNYNLIEDNVMYHGGHHVLGLYGMYNVVRNNYFHNEVWLSGYGNRIVYVNGYAQNSGRNLIEGNRIAYSAKPPDNYGGAGMALDSSYNIVRRNLFYHNDLVGINMTTSGGYQGSPTYNRIYNNSFYHNAMSTNPNAGSELLAAIGFTNYGGPGPVTQNAVKNNIFRSNRKSYGLSGASLSNQIIAANWEEAGDPQFVNASAAGDPLKSDLPDLRLKSGSPCIDAGTYLTKISSASGSGTTFQVEDAGYFMDGWGIVQGDNIQLAGTTQTARITAINYGTKTITVGSSVTWTQGQGVSLPFHGSDPDMGAYEYQQGVKQPSPPKNLRVSN